MAKSRGRESSCAKHVQIAYEITRHLLIGDHVVSLGMPYNMHYRSSGEEGENLKHFLRDCLALARTRLRILGKLCCGDLKDISSCKGELHSFVNVTG